MADADPSVQTPSTTDAPATPPGDAGAPAPVTGSKPDAAAAEGAKPVATLLTSEDEAGKPDAAEAKPDDAGKPEEGKPEDGKAAVPEKYEVKLAEGVELDTGAIEALTPVLKDLGISAEGFQKLATAFTDYAVKAEAAKDAQFREWLTSEVAANEAAVKQEWGREYEANLKVARRAIARFADAGVKKILDDTGLGSHPAFLKMFLPIGRLISEDSPPSGATPTARKSDGELFYGAH